MFSLLERLYRHRVLIEILVTRELKARYRGTALGFLWSFANPLLLMVIYSLVFKVYMRIDMPNYSLFLLCGLLPWNSFSLGIGEGTQSIVGNAGLIRRVCLPSEIFPLVSVCASLIHYLLSVPLLISAMLLAGFKFSWALTALPLVVLIQATFTYGLTLFSSSLSVRFRDMFYIIPNLMMILMMLTPIFYPSSQVPQAYHLIVDLNPLAQMVDIYHSLFFYGQWPKLKSIAMLSVLSLILIATGSRFFDHRKETFAEEI